MSRPIQTILQNIDASESGFLNGAVAGTQAASKVVLPDANVNIGVTKVTECHIGTSGSETQITATGAEINSVCDRSGRIVPVTSATLSLTNASHADRIVTYSKADGGAITLPAAAGLGGVYTVTLGATITSNSTTIKAASAADSFVGIAFGVDTDTEGATGYTWNADAADDTVTMQGAATGGLIGDTWIFTDIATGIWLVRGFITQSGAAEATPFSATVS